MELGRLFPAALGLVVVLAGCSSARKAEAGGQAARQQSRQARPTSPRPARPLTPAEEMARINKLMAACPDLDQRMGEFREDLDRLARAASRVAGLRATLDEVDRLRATSVNVMGQRVGVWVAICRVSPKADALNPAIAKVNEVVRRCEQIVRLQGVVAGDYRIFKDALTKARARPGEETLAAVRDAAAGLHTRIALVERTGPELDGKLALIEGPLRITRDALNSVTTPSVQDNAKQLAYRVGRMLGVTTNARSQLRQHQSRIRGVMEALTAISAAR